MDDPTGLRPHPPRLGRSILRIVEERDCTPKKRALSEVNPSCYVFEFPGLWDALDQLGTGNAQGEYYLTDAPEHLKGMGRKVMRSIAASPTMFWASIPASIWRRRRR